MSYVVHTRVHTTQNQSKIAGYRVSHSLSSQQILNLESDQVDIEPSYEESHTEMTCLRPILLPTQN